jgi:hypothetical protein
MSRDFLEPFSRHEYAENPTPSMIRIAEQIVALQQKYLILENLQRTNPDLIRPLDPPEKAPETVVPLRKRRF